MTISPGSHLGPYVITGKLGAGGMGEVYRGTDSRLDREVAIKVLPAVFTQDPERLARFEREAKLLAQLHHPNIASIFGFESSDGLRLLAMELVEGPTLADRLESGALPVEECLAIARQIAEALEAAHEKGIVHRDLKPQNIKASVEGRVKVLDFGLAKAMNPAGSGGSAAPGSDAQVAQSPTLTLGATEFGVILGTAGYMAPEQAKGLAIDKRADIWAFGVVLYEMLTGERLFAGASVAETLANVLRADIDLGRLPAETPRPVRALVRRCLERTPRSRLHDIADARIVFEELALGRTEDSVGVPVAALTPTRRSPLVRTGGLALAALLLAGGGYWAGTRWAASRGLESDGAPQVVRFQQITDSPGVEASPSLSPDGKEVVFVGQERGRSALFLQRIGGRTPVLLSTDPNADDHQPVFSPDGQRIAFRSERDGGGVFVMDATGESVRRITDFGFNPTWSPDGSEIAVSPGNFVSPTDRGGKVAGLWAIDVATGVRREVSRAGDVMQPSWSPSGRRIAYWGLRGDSGQRDIWTIAADGSEVDAPGGLAVTNDTALDWSPAWSPDGRFLYFSSNRGGTMNVWRIAVDEASGQARGVPEPITTPSLWSGVFSFSRDGSRLVYGSLDWRSTLQRVAFDPRNGRVTGEPQALLRGTQPIRDHELSPDGQWVAFNRTSGQDDIAVARIDGSQMRRLTDDAFRDRGPNWAPDGSRIAFYSDRTGSYQIWTIRPDGSDLRQVTRLATGTTNFPVWSPDGSRIALSVIPSGPLLLNLEGVSEAEPLAEPGEDRDFWPLSWSPDGHRLAGISVFASGLVAEVALYDLRNREYTRLPAGSDNLWRFPIWLSDSRRLVVRDSRGIWLVDTAGSAEPRLLLEVGGYSIGASVGVTRDDRWITYSETGTEGDIWLAEFEDGS